MAKLGFLGLGLMGAPMARNLIKAGHDVALWSNTGAKAEQLAKEAGGKACATPAEAVRHAECVFLCVGDSAMSETVILGPQGLKEGAKKGMVVVDASTVSPSSSRRTHEELAKSGIDFLGAPCTGSTPGAINGTLTFMVGGDKEVFERVRPWLRDHGEEALLLWWPRDGAACEADAEPGVVEPATGLQRRDRAQHEGRCGSNADARHPLSNSAAKSGLIDYKAPFIFRRDFETNFSVKWMLKDMGLMLESAQELSVPLFLTGLSRQIFQAAIAGGHGDEDICSTIKVLEEITGVEVRS